MVKPIDELHAVGASLDGLLDDVDNRAFNPRRQNGGQRLRTAAASLSRSMLPGMSTSISRMRMPSTVSSCRRASSASHASTASKPPLQRRRRRACADRLVLCDQDAMTNQLQNLAHTLSRGVAALSPKQGASTRPEGAVVQPRRKPSNVVLCPCGSRPNSRPPNQIRVTP